MDECTVPQGAKVYGKVVAATKTAPESTLALQIESADCEGHPHTPFDLHILEVIAPDASNPAASSLPKGVGPDGSCAIVGASESAMSPERKGLTPAMRAGAVVGEDHMQLAIAEGPNFADVLHSDKRNVSLLTGTRLVPGTKDMIPQDQLLHLQSVGQP